MEDVARYECVYQGTVKISKTKTKRSTAGKKSGRNFIYLWGRWRFWRRFKSWRWRRLRTNKRNKFASSKISSSTSAMLFAAICPPVQRACNFDTSADRNVCNSRLCDRLRSSEIIWKSALREINAGEVITPHARPYTCLSLFLSERLMFDVAWRSETNYMHKDAQDQ